ncbi:hypothetical protein BJ138DRAFT_1115057 [Hygrophoropsis aurantiaca]|uniref:Uncharacterized protein n=1 Tax=Hygrophoropsis aurantiaca TaxID=72124 RepID=A0ACB8A8E7_9AGAM|nr:hypothetical protein BJ138DRAFT_1115057 [Hygrophoropsis aurantiaca]
MSSAHHSEIQSIRNILWEHHSETTGRISRIQNELASLNQFAHKTSNDEKITSDRLADVEAEFNGRLNGALFELQELKINFNGLMKRIDNSSQKYEEASRIEVAAGKEISTLRAMVDNLSKAVTNDRHLNNQRFQMLEASIAEGQRDFNGNLRKAEANISTLETELESLSRAQQDSRIEAASRDSDIDNKLEDLSRQMQGTLRKTLDPSNDGRPRTDEVIAQMQGDMANPRSNPGSLSCRCNHTGAPDESNPEKCKEDQTLAEALNVITTKLSHLSRVSFNFNCKQFSPDIPSLIRLYDSAVHPKLRVGTLLARHLPEDQRAEKVARFFNLAVQVLIVDRRYMGTFLRSKLHPAFNHVRWRQFWIIAVLTLIFITVVGLAAISIGPFTMLTSVEAMRRSAAQFVLLRRPGRHTETQIVRSRQRGRFSY